MDDPNPVSPASREELERIAARLLEVARGIRSQGASAIEARELEEAASALKASEARERTWRPIETAPKDGTVVDLWRDYERLTDWQYDQRRGGWFKKHGYPEVTAWLTKPPTHWMPVPADPDCDDRPALAGGGSTQ